MGWRGERVVAVAIFAAMAGTTPASASEEIRDFSAAITIESDGAIEVVERIEVRAEGNQIKRGIFRDIPQIRSFGPLPMRLPIDVVAVSRDGEPEPYRVTSTAEGLRVYIGDAERRLDDGVYTCGGGGGGW